MDFDKKTDLANDRSDADKLDIDKLKNSTNSKIPPYSRIITTLNANINEVKKQIAWITNLATTAALNTKTNEVKSKIPNITNLTATTALTAVENKITDHGKYVTSRELNKLTAEHFAAKLAQANLARKNDIAIFVKKSDFDGKLNNLKKKIYFK